MSLQTARYWKHSSNLGLGDQMLHLFVFRAGSWTTLVMDLKEGFVAFAVPSDNLGSTGWQAGFVVRSSTTE